MVVSVENQSSDRESQPATQVTKPIPPGDYRLVGWDLDSTGRHLLDEIVQIAAYTPDKSFSQYVMPYRDVNPIAKKQYNIRVVTIHRYRMLKHNKTNKVIKTKSEISGLVDFLTWLEEVKGDKKGIILVSHEPRQLCPMLLLQALEKYSLQERFQAVVAGFAKGFAIAEAKCSKTVRRFSLRALSTVLLSEEIELDSAVNRAQLAFKVLQQVCSSEENGESSAGGGGDSITAGGNSESIVPLVCQYTEAVSTKQEELGELRRERERQEGLRPLFRYLLRLSLRHRRRALQLRQHLLDADVTLSQLDAAWEQQQLDALKAFVDDKLAKLEEADRTELIQLLEHHYIPESRPKPEPRPKAGYRDRRQGRNRSSSRNGNGTGNVTGNGTGTSGEENGANKDDKSSSLGTTPSSESTTPSNDSPSAVPSPKKERKPRQKSVSSETKEEVAAS